MGAEHTGTRASGSAARRRALVAVLAAAAVAAVAGAALTGGGSGRATGATATTAPRVPTGAATRATTTSSTAPGAPGATSTTTTTATTLPPTGPAVTTLVVVPASVTCSGPPASVSLQWTTRDATGVDVTVDRPPVFGSYGSAGTVAVPVPCDGAPHDYVVTAKGAGGTHSSRTAVVEATKVAAGPAAPAVHSFFATRVGPLCGAQTATLTIVVQWDVRNAVRVHVDVQFAGGRDFPEAAGSARFIVACTGAAAGATDVHVSAYAVGAGGRASATAAATVVAR